MRTRRKFEFQSEISYWANSTIYCIPFLFSVNKWLEKHFRNHGKFKVLRWIPLIEIYGVVDNSEARDTFARLKKK